MAFPSEAVANGNSKLDLEGQFGCTVSLLPGDAELS